MRKALLYLVVFAAAVAGGYWFWTHYEIEGLQGLDIRPRGEEPGASSRPGGSPAVVDPEEAAIPQPEHEAIRVATLNCGPLDAKKLNQRDILGYLVRLVRRFDVVALQDIRARNQGVVLELVDEANAEGRHYDFALPPEVALGRTEQYSVFLFDKATVQIDRSTVYTVSDPDGRFRHPPLVASFVARGPEMSEAFTFTLVNVHTDPSRAVIELDLLDDVYRAVRDEGRGEDDVLLVGDFAADGRSFGELGRVPNLAWAISGIPTTTRGTRLVDNVLFDRVATAEFTGRADVVDLMREFDLPMREVLAISEHLPVWAEFSIYEGGRLARVAARPEGAPSAK